MSMEYASFSTAQTGLEFVPGHAGEVIRVVMILVTCWVSAKLTLLSDPGGDDERELAAPLYIGAGQPLLVRLGRHHALPADPGRALGVTTSYQSTVAPLTLTVWYEWVQS
jgi:hypothetical protein